MNITVLGTGSVGLITGVSLAYLDHPTLCAELSHPAPKRDDGIGSWEPGLNELLLTTIHRQTLRFASDLSEAVREADVIYIAAGNSSSPHDSVNSTLYRPALEAIAFHAPRNPLVVLQGTVPQGMTKATQRFLRKHSGNETLSVVHHTEWMRRGKGIRDFFQSNRLVIGTRSERAREVTEEIYRDLPISIRYTDPSHSEWIQYAYQACLVPLSSNFVLSFWKDGHGNDRGRFSPSLHIGGKGTP
ncbi:hypothetical protein [Paludifilum halophilum]|nr:hypothetical protein [Paludifilum halophilum]